MQDGLGLPLYSGKPPTNPLLGSEKWGLAAEDPHLHLGGTTIVADEFFTEDQGRTQQEFLLEHMVEVLQNNELCTDTV